MNSPHHITHAVRLHAAEGLRKHADFKHFDSAYSALHRRLSLWRTATQKTPSSERDLEVARRTLQLAGLCVKVLNNFDLPLTIPPDSNSLPPSEPDRPHVP